MSHLSNIKVPLEITTYIEAGALFPGIMDTMWSKYESDIARFVEYVNSSKSSAELLAKIRSPDLHRKERMPLLKLFRRCVSSVCDTERTKKINVHPTEELVEHFGDSFKPIEELKDEFNSLSSDKLSALALLIGEYDNRGQLGYTLTEMFFEWFEGKFPEFEIRGPRGAGKDLQLRDYMPGFTGEFPADFVVLSSESKLLAVGFSRYDSTRGGAQSDDRTEGNRNKVAKLQEFAFGAGQTTKLIFLSDGPGLAHADTWQAACDLDDSWGGNVRVVTLKIAEERLTREWLVS